MFAARAACTVVGFINTASYQSNTICLLLPTEQRSSPYNSFKLIIFKRIYFSKWLASIHTISNRSLCLAKHLQGLPGLYWPSIYKACPGYTGQVFTRLARVILDHLKSYTGQPHDNTRNTQEERPS